jgi:hypothetical protein
MTAMRRERAHKLGGKAWAACVALVFVSASAFSESSASDHWVGTWATATFARNDWRLPEFQGVTLRQILHTSVAGKALRIRLSNEFGTDPLTIDAAHVALSAGLSTLLTPDEASGSL